LKERKHDAAAALPLPTLLSHALVAFTIEFDNEAEQQLPHWTTNFGSAGGSREATWLVSLVMWPNCMEHVGDEGITVRDLEKRARTKTNLNGMERWGYVTVEPDPEDRRPKPPGRDWVIRATPAGRQAQAIWRPLFGTIEKRWEERFGKKEIEQLRESLLAILRQMNFALPDCMPILGYGLLCRVPYLPTQTTVAQKERDLSQLPLPALLSKALLAFAAEFEAESRLSLAIYANVLRVLDEDGIPVRDLPRVTGVSKESIRMAMGILRKTRLVIEGADPKNGRTKVIRLTALGRATQDRHTALLAGIEERWRERFGIAPILGLRRSLEGLEGDGTPEASALFEGLKPHPENWRSKVPPPSTLPHFPMVLHRGGYPDGS
jgi:DNA-binding MarR family transcriptional regulator